MGKERKPIVVLVDQNPATVTLSREVRNLEHIELVYFKLMRMSLTGVDPPYNFSIKIRAGGNVRNDEIIPSNNAPVGGYAAVPFAKLQSDTVPLHYDSSNVAYFGGVPQNVPYIFGKQPKGMRWRADNVSSMSCFEVTLLSLDGTPYNFSNTGTTMELVFDATFEPPVNQTKDWRTDQVYMNSMNS